MVPLHVLLLLQGAAPARVRHVAARGCGGVAATPAAAAAAASHNIIGDGGVVGGQADAERCPAVSE